MKKENDSHHMLDNISSLFLLLHIWGVFSTEDIGAECVYVDERDKFQAKESIVVSLG